MLDADATTLAAGLKAGRWRAGELVEAAIARIRRVNPVLNCVVAERFEQARLEAALADEGELQGPLAGVPISIKDCFDVAGLPTTVGLRHRRAALATRDAAVVARLRAAGAIVVAKTNMPALGLCQETDNKLFGRTNNPWDPRRTPGGSSGGEAALVAVGGVACGLGSDIGGSLRFPAHFAGVVSFKGARDAVSLDGHYPPDPPRHERPMLGIGPLCKSVADAELLYGLIADAPVPDAGERDVLVPEPHPDLPLAPAARTALAEARRVLAAPAGTRMQDLPGFDDAADMWQLAMAWDGGAAVRRLTGVERPFRQFLREKYLGDTDHHLFLLWAMVGMGLFAPRGRARAELDERLAAARGAAEAYLKTRVVVLPVYHRPAAPHGVVYAELFSIRKTFARYLPTVIYANAMGLPALTVPVAEDQGLPIALQLIGHPGAERAIFAAGRRLEAAMRGYRRCALHD